MKQSYDTETIEIMPYPLLHWYDTDVKIKILGSENMYALVVEKTFEGRLLLHNLKMWIKNETSV